MQAKDNNLSDKAHAILSKITQDSFDGLDLTNIRKSTHMTDCMLPSIISASAI